MLFPKILRFNDNKKEWNSIHMKYGVNVIDEGVVRSRY